MKRTKIAELIGEHGQAVISVFDDQGGALPFTYTIGNAMHGLPELLCIGAFPPEVITPLLNRLGADMRKNNKSPGEEVFLGGQFPLRCRWAGASARRDYTLQATSFLGRTDYNVVQVILCDKAGKFPGEAGVSRQFDVPIL